MQKAQRASIQDLAALSGELSDESLRLVSGSADTKHIVMDPIFVYKMPSTCTGDKSGDYD